MQQYSRFSIVCTEYPFNLREESTKIEDALVTPHYDTSSKQKCAEESGLESSSATHVWDDITSLMIHCVLMNIFQRYSYQKLLEHNKYNINKFIFFNCSDIDVWCLGYGSYVLNYYGHVSTFPFCIDNQNYWHTLHGMHIDAYV